MEAETATSNSLHIKRHVNKRISWSNGGEVKIYKNLHRLKSN